MLSLNISKNCMAVLWNRAPKNESTVIKKPTLEKAHLKQIGTPTHTRIINNYLKKIENVEPFPGSD